FLHEIPVLCRASRLERIVAHVLHPASNRFRRAEKHFPARTAPNRMIWRAASGGDESGPAVVLQASQHLFSRIAMAADHQMYQMYMIGHDRTSIAGVIVFPD